VTIYVELLVGYLFLQVSVGLWVSRSVRTTGGFFVADRSLGPGLLFSTLIAANIGAGSTVGAAGLGYRDGLSAWWWVGSAAIGSVILAFAVGPRIRAIASKHNLQTVGDFLEYRYGHTVRGIVAALLWLGTLAILAGQIVAMGLVLNAVLGLPKWVGCLAGGAVMTAYSTAGGLMTAAWVNSLQLVVELIVFGTLLPLTLHVAGGWENVAAKLPQNPEYWSFFQGGASGITYIALLVPAFIVSPGLLQKVYGARDDRAVRIGVGLNALVLLLFAFIPTLVGMTARSLHPNLPHPELALPTLLVHDLPPLFGAFALAAVFSTEVNTADAILFMLSTSLSRDLYKGYVNPAASDRQILKVARWAAVGGGTLGVAMAVAAPSVIGALSIFYTVLGVCLFVPIVAGLYVRKVGNPEALAAVCVGVAAMVAVHLATGGKGFGIITPASAGIAISIAAALPVALIRARFR
jgi:SSS family solute:Na+ symporter